MSDNPTLWVKNPDRDTAHATCWPWWIEKGIVRRAERADVLAALGDKKWRCEWVIKRCKPSGPLDGDDRSHSGCHWAVKP